MCLSVSMSLSVSLFHSPLSFAVSSSSYPRSCYKCLFQVTWSGRFSSLLPGLGHSCCPTLECLKEKQVWTTQVLLYKYTFSERSSRNKKCKSLFICPLYLVCAIRPEVHSVPGDKIWVDGNLPSKTHTGAAGLQGCPGESITGWIRAWLDLNFEHIKELLDL